MEMATRLAPDDSAQVQGWGKTLAVSLLGLSTLVGCATKEPESPRVPPHEVIQSNVVLPIEGLEVDQPSLNQSNKNQPFLNQMMLLEKTLLTLRKHTDENGWTGGDELRSEIKNNFAEAEHAVLTQLKTAQNDPQVTTRFERLYESLHVVKRLFEENGLARSGRWWGESATDGTFSYVYGLEAQLMLLRATLSPQPHP